MEFKPPVLKFPRVKPRIRQSERGIEIWDSLRGKWLMYTPEEWVRRHVIGYLSSHCNLPEQRIVQEYPVPLNGQPQRADIVAVDDNGAPLLLVECKAPDIEIDQSVLDQAVRYNSVLQARWIILTNGKRHYCYHHEDNRYTPCGFPTF